VIVALDGVVEAGRARSGGQSLSRLWFGGLWGGMIA